MEQTSKHISFTGGYIRNLTVLVFVAILGGTLFGYYMPENCALLFVVSSYFFKLLALLILPVIFLAIVYGICKIAKLSNPQLLVWHTLLYFVLETSLCIVLGLTFASLIQPGKSSYLATVPQNESFAFVLELQGDGSLVSKIYANRQIVFLILALVLGVSICISKYRESCVRMLEGSLSCFYRLIKYVYLLLPFVVFCNIAYSMSIYGIDALLPLSKVLATVYLTNIFFVGIVLGLLGYWFGIDIWVFLRLLKAEIFLVLVTSSSKTAFPMVFEKLPAQGYSRSIVSFVIPLGYCFNLAGACIYLSICTVFLVQFYDISLQLKDYIRLFFIITLTSKTASGVPGSGFLALMFTLDRFGGIPMSSMMFLYSIDRFMNEARAVTNFMGIAMCAAVLSKIYNKKGVSITDTPSGSLGT